MVVDRRETIRVEGCEDNTVEESIAADSAAMCDADSLVDLCLARLLALQLKQKWRRRGARSTYQLAILSNPNSSAGIQLRPQ